MIGTISIVCGCGATATPLCVRRVAGLLPFTMVVDDPPDNWGFAGDSAWCPACFQVKLRRDGHTPHFRTPLKLVVGDSEGDT